MLCRVALLLMTTWAFAAIWESDKPSADSLSPTTALRQPTAVEPGLSTVYAQLQLSIHGLPSTVQGVFKSLPKWIREDRIPEPAEKSLAVQSAVDFVRDKVTNTDARIRATFATILSGIGHGRSRLSQSSIDEIPMDDLWMFGGVDFPLPAGIRCGTYHVVDGSGRSFELTLDESELAYHGIQPGYFRQDLYVSDVGQQRRYFIRMEDFESNMMLAKANREKTSNSITVENGALQSFALHADQANGPEDYLAMWNAFVQSTSEMLNSLRQDDFDRISRWSRGTWAKARRLSENWIESSRLSQERRESIHR